MKKLGLVLLIASLFIVGCQPSAVATQTPQDPTASPCTDRGWADITAYLYEFDNELAAVDPHGDVSGLVEQLETTIEDLKKVDVDGCAENAKSMIVTGLEKRVLGTNLIANGDEPSARMVLRDGYRTINSAGEQLIGLGIKLNYPER